MGLGNRWISLEHFKSSCNGFGIFQIGNPYRFTVRRFDAESSMYYYRTRYMDPEIGRFVSRDTIGLYGDPNNLGNGQAYVGNNPWTLTDPYGEDALWSLPADNRASPRCRGGPDDLPSLNELHEQLVADPINEQWPERNAFVSGFTNEFLMVPDDPGLDNVAGWSNAQYVAGQFVAVVGPMKFVRGARTGFGGIRAAAGRLFPRRAMMAVGPGEHSWWNEFLATVSMRMGSNVAHPKGQWLRVKEGMPARARAYQKQITGREYEAYVVQGVKFDGFDEATGILLEVKGPGYQNFIKNGDFQYWFDEQANVIDQAQRQLRAAGDAPIVWAIADEHYASLVKELFRTQRVSIEVVHVPAH